MKNPTNIPEDYRLHLCVKSHTKIFCGGLVIGFLLGAIVAVCVYANILLAYLK
jgi:hypothetical protein